MNPYLQNKDTFINDYIADIKDIHTDKNILGYLTDYHTINISTNRENFSFFISLDKETMEELDEPISYNDVLMVADWRQSVSGTDFMICNRKLFKEYITLRDVLDASKKHSYYINLLNDSTNIHIELVGIHKKTDYQLEFYFNML